MKDITKKDWIRYDWIDVSTPEEPGVFIRAAKDTAPPNDGFAYVDITKLGDKEQVWIRAQEAEELK